MKIALVDLETAPNLGYVWEKWETNVIEFESDWYILSFAVKWLGQRGIKVHALPDFKTKPGDDSLLVSELWECFNAADVVVAHNGDRFDIRKSNARFIAHNLPPPSPYKTVDTLKIARRHFKFTSNRLDDLGQALGCGRKLPTTGKHLWLGCMRGDPKAWAMMRKYNAQDVALLERVYLKLRPWAATHPNLNYLSRQDGVLCPSCQSPNIQYRGFNFTRTGKRQRVQCCACGAWSTTGGLIKCETIMPAYQK